jgi:hypothetical protein
MTPVFARLCLPLSSSINNFACYILKDKKGDELIELVQQAGEKKCVRNVKDFNLNPYFVFRLIGLDVFQMPQIDKQVNNVRKPMPDLFVFIFYVPM